MKYVKMFESLINSELSYDDQTMKTIYLKDENYNW